MREIWRSLNMSFCTAVVWAGPGGDSPSGRSEAHEFSAAARASGGRQLLQLAKVAGVPIAADWTGVDWTGGDWTRHPKGWWVWSSANPATPVHIDECCQNIDT